ncbi:acyl-homoserine-lactone synthase [Azospirillum sp. sgz302134]
MHHSDVLIVPPALHRTHAGVLEQFAQLRYQVFAEQLGWHLPMAANGYERDEWDDERATYVVVRGSGPRGDIIRAAIRLHSTDGHTLLTRVFPQLVQGSLPQGPDIWEGTRMLVNPVVAGDRGAALQELLCATVDYGLRCGVRAFVSVSDSRLERVLLRCGAQPRRLGPSVEVQPGIEAVALHMECSIGVLSRLRRRLAAVQPDVLRSAA